MKKINPLSLALKLGLVIVLAYITHSPPNSYNDHKTQRITHNNS